MRKQFGDVSPQVQVFARDEALDLEFVSKARLHHHGKGFKAPWQSNSFPKISALLKWKLLGNGAKPVVKRNSPPPMRIRCVRPSPDILNKKTGLSIIYLGHSTVLIKLGSLNILTDPVFWLVFPFVQRNVPFPVSLGEMPEIDAVVISHDHYDHLDTMSIAALGERPVYFVPLRLRKWFENIMPSAKVIEMDWFEEGEKDSVLFRFLPAQHWSKRFFFSKNRILWGSWLIQWKGIKIFFCGDSGYFEGFKEFGYKFGPVDIALMPIGAFEPRWFMKSVHMNPEEAILAARDLGAEYIIPIHWGIFRLSEEPPGLPPVIFREAALKAGIDEEHSPILMPGEVFEYPI